MIESFANELAELVYKKDPVPRKVLKGFPLNLVDKAALKLDILNAVTSVEQLYIPPSNKFERLRGKLKDYYSIRINEQWRIIFTYEDSIARDVQIVDYH